MDGGRGGRLLWKIKNILGNVLRATKLGVLGEKKDKARTDTKSFLN